MRRDAFVFIQIKWNTNLLVILIALTQLHLCRLCQNSLEEKSNCISTWQHYFGESIETFRHDFGKSMSIDLPSTYRYVYIGLGDKFTCPDL